MPLAPQILAWLLALAWFAKFLETARGLPQIPTLTSPDFDIPTPAPQPSLTVIVPARNEAAAISACLQSLLTQDYPHLHILAVDDRSTDPTAAIIDALAHANPTRLESLHIAELPANWLGKTHAMATAARLAIARHNPDWLLFTDADIVFHPEVLRRALACAIATRADHFVTLPTTLVKSPGEGMILSFLQVMGLWAVRPWRAPAPGPRDAIGVGAFNLIRTSAYLQLGGFDAIPMEILEDLTLGRRVKLAGLRQRVASAPGMVTVHWAAGLFGILNNMTKNLFAVFSFRIPLLLGAAAWLAIFCLAPIALLAPAATRLPALLTLASIAGIYALSSRTSRISPAYAALFPLSALLLIYSMLRSMLVTLRQGGVTWRGTFYPLTILRNPTHRPPQP